MGAVIGDFLPAAFGVALSPMPLVMLLVLLFTRRARINAVAFTLGWMLGVAVPVVLALALGVGSGGTGSGPNGWVNLVLGALFVLLAVTTFRGRPHAGETPKPPKWMASLQTMSPWAAFGIAALIIVLNAKNLPILVASALAISGAGLPAAEQVIATVVFVVVASSSAIVIAGAFLMFGDRVEPTLRRMREWLERNNAYVMTFLFAFLGISALGKALQAFT